MRIGTLGVSGGFWGADMKIFIAINQARVLYDFKRELVAAFLARGDEVFLSFEEDFRAEYFYSTGATVLPTPIDPRGMDPVRDAKLYLFYKKALRRVRPDAVLTFTIKPNVYCGRACRTLKIPYFATISGLGVALNAGGALAAVSRALYRSGVRGARGVFCQNESIARYAVANRFASESQIVRVAGSGVDLDRFPYLEYPAEEDQIEFLFIGRLMRDKGIGEYLECAKRIRASRPNAVFRILGAPERGCDSYGAVTEAARRGLVEYLGYKTDVTPYLANCSAVTLPSWHEGLSNVLLEGAASGRPLIASNVPGCAETFDDGVTGFGFEPRSADALVDAVERFLATPYETRREMGRKGREKVAAAFDRNKVVATYLDAVSNRQ